MDIYQHSILEVESFVSSHSEFLDEQVKKALNPTLDVETVSRNPNQGGRNSIYDLHLSDGSIIVLKLYGKDGIEKEVAGMTYANASGLPCPGLLGYDPTNNNPLQNPFLLMEHVDLDSWVSRIKGDYEVGRWGKVFGLNREALSAYVEEASDLFTRLHQVSAPINPGYSHKEMEKLFGTFATMIQERTALDVHQRLIGGLIDIFQYYEENPQPFLESPEYHLHGDLDPSNVPHTKDGLKFIDWENYHMGDCAEDIAYFAERILWIPEDVDEQIGNIVENYSKNDSTFGTRLGFHLPLSKLWHVVVKNIPKEEFLEAGTPKPL